MSMNTPRTNQRSAIVVTIVGVFGAVCIVAWAQSSGEQIDASQHRFRQDQLERRSIGATGCTGCHNGKIDHAYSKWRGEEHDGAHYLAHKTLENDPRSYQMAKLLAEHDGSEPDPTKRDDCRTCHSFDHDVPAKLRGKHFDIQDGVTCEACHGRAGDYLDLHNSDGWRDQQEAEWKRVGMYEMRDLKRWAEKCLQCHMGTPGNPMTHTLLAAGHPPLTFELVTDSFDVPLHWDFENTYLHPEEGSWYFVRLWAVGQAVTFRETMLRLARWADRPEGPPDFAFFDCYSCHHEYLRTPSREQDIRSLGRLGEPGWGASSWIICRHVVSVVAPEAKTLFEDQIVTLSNALTLSTPKRRDVRTAAVELARLADELAAKVAQKPFNRDSTIALLRAVLTDEDELLATGLFGADQLYQALSSLYAMALAESPQKPANDEQIMQSIERLGDLIYDKDAEFALENFKPAKVRRVVKELAGHFAE